MAKWKLKQRAPFQPLPLGQKHWQCQNCNMRVFWSFGRDGYIHTESRDKYCHPGKTREVAHPRIKQ